MPGEHSPESVKGNLALVLELFGHGTDYPFNQSIYGICFYSDRYHASLKTLMMTNFKNPFVLKHFFVIEALQFWLH